MTFDFDTFLSVIAVYVMIVISPGPNFVLVTQYSLRHRISLAFAVTLGLAAGATINASITMFGVGALIVAYPAFGFAITVLGGVFMGYLGISAIWSAIKERAVRQYSDAGDFTIGRVAETRPKALVGRESHSVALQKGLLVNLLNPKGIVFFIGLYGPLIAHTNMLTKSIILTASFAIEIVWYVIVVVILSRPRFRNWYEFASFSIDCILGVVLLVISINILMGSGGYF